MNTVSLNKPSSKIGVLLKAYRESVGLHQSAVARRAGISTSMLSQIERSAVSPSIDTLFSVCGALGVAMSQLFRSIADQDRVHIRQRGERLVNDTGGVCYEQLALTVDTAHPAELFLLKIEPGRSVGMPESGHGGEEMGYVLSGTAVLTVNGKEYAIQNGDSVSFNSTFPHRLYNNGKRTFNALWSVSPPHRDYLEIELI